MSPPDVPLVDGLVHDVKSTWLHMAAVGIDLLRKFPSRVVATIHESADLLKSFAIIGVFLLGIAVIAMFYYRYPRPTWISRSLDATAYLHEVYFPHLLKALQDARQLQGNPALATQLRGTLPLDDDEALYKLLTGYFRCYSHHTLTPTGRDRFGFFPMPDRGDTVTRAQHDAITALRAALQAFARSAPGEGLWVSLEDFKRGGGAAQLRQQAGGSYEDYLRRARTEASAVAGALEAHMMLNVYLDSIVVMMDSRQRRLWGNPYVFHYFLSDQTRVTSDHLKRAWSQDYLDTRRHIERIGPIWYKSLGPRIARLPRTIAEMI